MTAAQMNAHVRDNLNALGTMLNIGSGGLTMSWIAFVDWATAHAMLAQSCQERS